MEAIDELRIKVSAAQFEWASAEKCSDSWGVFGRTTEGSTGLFTGFTKKEAEAVVRKVKERNA